MINEEDIENMLFQAQSIFKLNKGMSPMIFMRIKGDLIIEDIDMSSLEATCNSVKKYKSMIESGELEQYVFMKEIHRPYEEWVLIVIKANPKEELQWICDIDMKDQEYKFSEWICYDSTNFKAKKNSFTNLFGQVFCKYN